MVWKSSPDMANVTITQLSAAGPIQGDELVPIVQNGQTLRTTTAALAGSPVQTQTFLTLVQEPTLNNSRYLSGGTGIGLQDNGAQSYLQIVLNGASGSLELAPTGLVVKTGSSTVTSRSIVASTSGLSVSNGDGVSGNPTIALTGLPLALTTLGGTGLLAVVGGTTIAGRQILGTDSEISVSNGNGSGNISIALYTNPILPGSGSVIIPKGTTAQRLAAGYGAIRYNTDTGILESYTQAVGGWGGIVSGAGVASFSAGATGFSPSVPTTGGIVLSGVLNVANGGTALSASPAAGQLLIGTGTGYSLNTLTAGSGVSISNAAGAITVANTGVLSFSGSTTGLTPSTPTAGNVVLDGILNIANGGTGSSTAAGAPFALKGANSDITSISGLTGSISTPTYIDFNTGATVTSAVGRIYWDGGTTLNVGMTANVTGRVMEAQYIYAKASAAITKGQLCYHTGAVGASGVITVAPTPLALSDPNQIVGVAAETIALNGFGLIQINGDLRGFNTTGSSVGETWADGDPLYYNPAYVGSFTKNKPLAPNQKTYIGEVTNAGAGSSGSIHVRIVPGSVLGGTDSNVQFGVLSNNDLIQYNSTLGYWANVGSGSVTVGTATNAINTGITANSTNATNYLTFVSATSGNLPQLVNSSITCNPGTGQITGGIAGGSF